MARETIEYIIITILSGEITTDGNGAGTVTFTTALPDTNYAISLTAVTSADTTACMANSKATTGFGVVTEDDGGKTEPNIMVGWHVAKFNNP